MASWFLILCENSFCGMPENYLGGDSEVSYQATTQKVSRIILTLWWQIRKKLTWSSIFCANINNVVMFTKRNDSVLSGKTSQGWQFFQARSSATHIQWQVKPRCVLLRQVEVSEQAMTASMRDAKIKMNNCHINILAKFYLLSFPRSCQTPWGAAGFSCEYTVEMQTEYECNEHHHFLLMQLYAEIARGIISANTYWNWFQNSIRSKCQMINKEKSMSLHKSKLRYWFDR